jgi:hypothetical protein
VVVTAVFEGKVVDVGEVVSSHVLVVEELKWFNIGTPLAIQSTCDSGLY